LFVFGLMWRPLPQYRGAGRPQSINPELDDADHRAGLHERTDPTCSAHVTCHDNVV
jgi:hypothetical protein